MNESKRGRDKSVSMDGENNEIEFVETIERVRTEHWK